MYGNSECNTQLCHQWFFCKTNLSSIKLQYINETNSLYALNYILYVSAGNIYNVIVKVFRNKQRNKKFTAQRMTFYVCTLQLSAQVLLVVELHAFHQSVCITNKERNKEKRKYSLNFTTQLQSHLCPIIRLNKEGIRSKHWTVKQCSILSTEIFVYISFSPRRRSVSKYTYLASLSLPARNQY